jgi:hypothetical protein
MGLGIGPSWESTDVSTLVGVCRRVLRLRSMGLSRAVACVHNRAVGFPDRLCRGHIIGVRDANLGRLA